MRENQNTANSKTFPHNASYFCLIYTQVYEGDEIDLVLDEPANNSKLMYVSRVEVRHTGQYNSEQGKLVVILRRYPKLLVEKPQNFTREQSDEWIAKQLSALDDAGERYESNFWSSNYAKV